MCKCECRSVGAALDEMDDAIMVSQLAYTIVSRGDWLGKPANIKVENNGVVGYVGSSLTVHNP